jgi:hypothetical protein
MELAVRQTQSPEPFALFKPPVDQGLDQGVPRAPAGDPDATMPNTQINAVDLRGTSSAQDRAEYSALVDSELSRGVNDSTIPRSMTIRRLGHDKGIQFRD